VSVADTFEIDERRVEKSAWLQHWDWFFVLSVAWLLFDLFMQPVLSICIASFKFGWSDFSNGFWLWRKDSDRRRGRTCLVFYVATGLWRITVTTFAVTLLGLLVYGFWLAMNPQQQAANRNQGNDILTGVSMMIVMFCFVFSSLSTWLAISMGLRNRVRVWIDSSIRYSRRNRIWPPESLGNNQVSRVVTSSLIFLVTALFVGVISILASQAGRAAQPIPPLLFGVVFVSTLIGCAVLLLAGRSWLLRKLAATSPADCWAENSLRRGRVSLSEELFEDRNSGRDFLSDA
tara:strand:+ start:67237 stop:68103 length:867 start_codon:yes stop_codon:yes gene_type:complete